ncbi:hypothetical protein BDQ17DRAFT_1436016 [Cyathus striatus]|nr:hypothetical protein BDQ17DRAFT_1436016 [Cyathus striatus]
MLTWHSEVFSGMFLLPQPNQSEEGTRDDSPITLKGFTSEQFDHFLDWLFPSFGNATNHWEFDHWSTIYHIANMYCVSKAKEDAKDHLRSAVKYGNQNPARVLEFACKYPNMNDLFKVAFQSLIYKDISSLSPVNAQMIVVEHLLPIMKVRDLILRMRCNLSFTAPLISHANSCRDHKPCADEWFKHVGQKLHDLVKPQIEDIIRMLVLKGNMNNACWELSKRRIPHKIYNVEKDIIEQYVT